MILYLWNKIEIYIKNKFTTTTREMSFTENLTVSLESTNNDCLNLFFKTVRDIPFPMSVYSLWIALRNHVDQLHKIFEARKLKSR